MNQARLDRALDAIARERQRQEVLKRAGRFKYTCADPEMTLAEKLTVLVEEMGEVARAILEDGGLANDRHHVKLREELVQVGAVATAWLESLEGDDG